MTRQVTGDQSSLPEFPEDFRLTPQHLQKLRRALEKDFGSSAEFSDEQILEMGMDSLRLVWDLVYIVETRRLRGASLVKSEEE